MVEKIGNLRKTHSQTDEEGKKNNKELLPDNGNKGTKEREIQKNNDDVVDEDY
ncbi:hypothetical protein MMJ09_23445 [Bacillus vallismortis]|nr:hypothetical protein [Bacillus vallismortis]